MTLEARGISFSYPGTARGILNGVNLRLESGERLGLAAPSGFGKTTLCKILAGYERQDAGEVLIDGQAFLHRRGYCPVQMIWQHPEQAVDPRLRLKTTLAEAGAVDQRVIEGLGIEPAWLERYPAELSGGELQRFCIARALGEGTKFLVADEISAMLDLITQSQIWRFLTEETARRGIGLLAVSHSAPLLERVCTRIVSLSEA